MNKRFILLLIFTCVLACKTPEARKPETVKTGSFIKESALRNKERFQVEKMAIEAYIKKQNSKQFKTSEYGFWFSQDTLVTVNPSKLPEFGDIINFNFNLSGLDNQPIYSASELKTRNYAMDQDALFTGLREGLKLMRAGETYTFIFPSQKAYGYYGDQKKISSNTPLISQVTVHSITEKK